MADTRLNFLLTGRDQLSRVLDRAGDSAQRLRQRLVTAATQGSGAINHLTRDADGRLRDLQGRFTASGGAISRSVEAVKGSLLSLAPAAIPAAAGVAGALAPVVAQTAAAGAAAAAYAVALGPQVSAMGEAVKAEQAYANAVEESGARSKEAVTAQIAYARQMAKLPPATRQSAAALSVLKDEYKEWSNSLAADTLAPVTKSFAVFGALLPRLTPAVRGTSRELDRLITVVGGAVNTPGFERDRARRHSRDQARRCACGGAWFRCEHRGDADGGRWRDRSDGRAHFRDRHPVPGRQARDRRYGYRSAVDRADRVDDDRAAGAGGLGPAGVVAGSVR